MTPDASDFELAEAIANQNLAALELIYDRYSTLVYTLALKILRQPQEAEDLTQEVFLKLWRDQNYRPQRGTLSSFLTTLTRSRAIDRLRVQSNRRKILQRWNFHGASSPVTPMEQASWSERQSQINEALESLSPKHRQVLELSYFKGMSQSEIARELDLPLGTVKTWARKGLLQLREHFQSLHHGMES
ncbi:MAG: sigma-70 family RNA polymerase sigma factor [Acaryochloridaceae cyanobacterium RL_2_7]|nr:sigma-70 family RNA polymerase sigma factor [Acaryochloridaceae cyanobacterium RL_2_7]